MTAPAASRTPAMTARRARLAAERVLLRAGLTVARVPRDASARATYRRNRERYLDQARQAGGDEFPLGPDLPCLFDRTDEAGTARGHYFHQDLYVAQQIHARRPRRHVDVGSRIDGFVAHVASFRTVDVLDIRPLETEIPNITFRRLDLLEGAGEYTASTDSLSCLHALEHLGLGRYGDPVAVDGWRTGLTHLVDMLEPGGVLYLSVPIGPQRVEFDAHRVFSVAFLRDELERRCDVVDFVHVDDAGDLHRDSDVRAAEADTSFGCVYGCGIFTARRRA